uniref:Putative chymotrypsin 4 n=1 Tax=Ostrinia nubilalis TaxID=29057 RepID=I6TMX7_OSTNU|nr:putative chymotrypsin 4 [Ostrinia nubilalis]
MMKLLVVVLAVAAAYGEESPAASTSAYGYLANSVAHAEKLRASEETYLAQQRIVGGLPANLGQYPYQAGLLIDIIGLEGRNGVCGGSLISANRVITAAHCWFDGQNQAWRLTVVLGSVTLFTGGNRQLTSEIVVHPSWFPLLVRNDVAVIYLPNNVAFSNTISPVALPSGAEIEENFAGSAAIASGFGLTVDGGSISQDQFLSHVTLRVITNSVCRLLFPLILHDTNICTSGIGGVNGVGTCQGDSGGPLVINRENRPLLIGVTSFGSALGCQANFPAAYARVTSYIDFFNQNL